MRERENSLKEIVRNTVAAAVIVAIPNVDFHNVNAQILEANHIRLVDKSLEQKENDVKVFDQIDEFMDTNTGKAIAGLFLVLSAMNMIRTFHQSSKLDNKRKFAEALGASSSLLALSITMVAATNTEIDPRIPASLLMANAAFQTAYRIEDERQRWRGLPVVPGTVTAVAFFGIGTALLVDSLK